MRGCSLPAVTALLIGRDKVSALPDLARLPALTLSLIGDTMALDLSHTIRNIVRPQYAGNSVRIVSAAHESAPKIARGK